jgi:cytochrome c553
MKTVWMLVATGISFSALAADIKTGESKAQACVGCHGAQGKSLVPTFPRLAGQHAVYLESSLRDFKSGDRKNPMMSPFAAGLSETDMADIAAYFEAQK